MEPTGSRHPLNAATRGTNPPKAKPNREPTEIPGRFDT